jgi:hypothetical protein
VAKPEWLADKFWVPEEMAPEGKIDFEKVAEGQAKARKAAEDRLFTRKEDFRAELKEEMASEKPPGVPDDPTGYEVRIAKEISDNANFEIELDEKDPMLVFFRDAAHEANIDQHKFNELINAYMRIRMSELPDYEAEMKTLGDNGKMRVERAANWGKMNLKKENFETMASLATTAKTVQLFEELMELSGEPTFQISEDGDSYTEALTKDDLKAMMQDPRYHRDHDPAYIAKVRAGFAKLGRS